MHAITAMVYLLFLASRIASKPNVVYQIYLSFEFRILRNMCIAPYCLQYFFVIDKDTP